MIQKIKRSTPFIILMLATVTGYRAWLSFKVFFHADWWQFSHYAITHTNYYTVWTTTGLGTTNITFSRVAVQALQFWLSHWFRAGSNVTDKFLFFWPTALLASVAGYVLAKYITKNNWLAAAAGTVFAFNTYFLAINSEGDELITLAASLCVIALVLFMKAIQEGRNMLVVGAALLLAAASTFDFRMVYIAVFLFAFYTLLYFSKRSLRQLCILGALLLGLCLMWALPLEASASLTNNALFSRGLFGDNFWNLPAAMTLFHPFWTGYVPSWFMPEDVPFYFWIIPGLVLLAAIFLPRRKPLFYFLVIGVVGILLAKQVDQPFTHVYPWLYAHLPGFNAFREATKFYVIIALAYTAIIAMLIKYAASSGTPKVRYAGYAVSVGIAALFVYNLKPLATNEIGTLFVPRHIPAAYVKMNGLLDKSGPFYRTLWLPTVSPWVDQSDNRPSVNAADLVGSWGNMLGVNNNLPLSARLTAEITTPGAQTLISAASFKYIVVPLRDTSNDADFFQYYGNDRQFFVNALSSVSWLKRVNVGTNQLAVFQNMSERPYIAAANSVYGLQSAGEVPGLLPVMAQKFSDDFYLPQKGYQDKVGTGYLSSVFDTLAVDPGSGDILRQRENVPKNSSLYIDRGTRGVLYDVQKGVLRLYDQQLGGLRLNSKVADAAKQSTSQIAQTNLRPGGQYYIGNGSRLERVSPKQKSRLTFGSVSGATTVYSASTDNLIRDPSFEQGLWQKQVQDCNDFDNLAAIGMHVSNNNATNGTHSLELESLAHTACTSQQVAVRAGAAYLFSFDYGNTGGQKAGYKLTFDDPKHTTISQDLYTNNKDWRTLLRSVAVPAGASHLSVQVFGYPDQNAQNDSHTYYDNFRMSELRALASASAAPGGYQKVALPAGQATFTYQDANYPMANVIPDGSFEHGLWQRKVSDCNNYDNNPQIDMKLNRSQAANGQDSLELEASRHTACTGPAKSLPVSANTTYLLSFDYQSPTHSSAGYHISYDDPAGTAVSESLPVTTSNWQHYVTSLQIPAGATKLSLLVYATPGDGGTQSIARYDNFKLVQIPSVLNHYYVVTQPVQQVVKPRSVSWRAVNPTKKLVEIRGATTPFYLSMSEAYNPKWRLELNNAGVQGVLHNVSPVTHVNAVPTSDHVELNDFENSWYVDPTTLCQDHAAGCTRNADGSYDLRLIAEFTPQRWFYAGSIVSVVTFVGCIGYLIYSFTRRRHAGVHYKRHRRLRK